MCNYIQILFVLRFKMAADHVVDFQDYNVNVKDISKVNSDRIKDIGKQIVHNFKTYGYCYLKNHGVGEGLLDDFFTASQNFFWKPNDYKEKYAMLPDYAFGWVKLEREKGNKQRSAGDLHEAFNYRPFGSFNDVWPYVGNFETLVKQMHGIGWELSLRFMDVLSLGLDLPIDFMRTVHSKCSMQVRTIYYPPIEEHRKIAPDQARLGEHTDWGTVAFNFQDQVGGLEVRDPSGEFVQVPPLLNTVVVTPSALLQRWTADNIKAAVHRILLDDERRQKTRQAIILFVQPDDDIEIRCLDGSNKYEPITSEAYIMAQAKLSLLQ